MYFSLLASRCELPGPFSLRDKEIRYLWVFLYSRTTIYHIIGRRSAIKYCFFPELSERYYTRGYKFTCDLNAFMNDEICTKALLGIFSFKRHASGAQAIETTLLLVPREDLTKTVLFRIINEDFYIFSNNTFSPHSFLLIMKLFFLTRLERSFGHLYHFLPSFVFVKLNNLFCKP